MGTITKKQLLERIRKGSVSFKPGLDIFQLKPHAVDLRLGFTFLIPKRWNMTKRGREVLNIDHFDKNPPQYFETIELEQGQYFDLLPQEYVLASTFESIKVSSDLMAVLYPRSSTNRKGLSVDLTGIIDSGYEGQLVIPIRNNTNSQTVRLYPGERFCQIVFSSLEEEVDVEKSRYHQKDIVEGFIRRKEKKGSQDEKEIRFIRKGKIRELKASYAIKQVDEK